LGSQVRVEEVFMYRIPLRRAVVPAAWLAVLGLTACGDRDRSMAARDTAAGPETGMSADTAGTDTAAGATLTDANIVALLDEANKADSAAGALASTKATNKEVKDFARLMMSEHHALRKQGQQLAQQLNVTPEPPATNPLEPLVQGEMTALESTPKGPKFDQVYIEQEIAAHKAVLDLADQAHAQAQNEQLKGLIEQARPVIQKHLDQAEEIQGKLGEATS
jgi:putative membrane protein